MAVIPSKWIFRRHLQAMIELAGEPASVLEAGCALGKFSEWFPASRYVGTTLSEQGLDTAKAALPSREFYLADLGETASLPRDLFDLVICTHTISYVPRERFPAAVDNLRNATAPRGKAIIQFTEADADLLLPLISNAFSIVDHRRYGGRALRWADRAGIRLHGNSQEGLKGMAVRLANAIDSDQEHHMVLLTPRTTLDD